MLLTINYAWYHLFFCLLQPLVLYYFGRTRHFRIAHCFGLFGFLMDYGLMYLTQGKRTITYPGYEGNMDNGMETLGPLGNFIFFFWFDYGGFGVVLWALHFQDFIIELYKTKISKTATKTIDNIELFALLIVPLQFWTAPWLSSTILNVDSRTLILARSSPKSTYALMVPMFAFMLRYFGKVPNYQTAAIALSGFGCGCIHHLALFTFGLRGYTNYAALGLTLLTEWPALILGVACFSRFGGHLTAWMTNIRGTTLFRVVMWAGLISAMAPYLSNIKEQDTIGYLMPYVPGKYMQSLGTVALRSSTCLAPSYLPESFLPPKLDCWDAKRSLGSNDGTDMLIMASAAKSGAVLSARIVLEVGTACGYCVASGERSRAGIPGPVEELPSYEGKLLHAIINMKTWPQYVERMGYGPETSPKLNERVRCVTFLRDPIARLKSLYLYARSGGEAWFRYQSGLMQKLQDPNRTLTESIQFFWDEFGKEYLIQSHEYMFENLNLGCTGITMEGLKKDFDGNIGHLLHVWGIKPATIPLLVKRLEDADLSRKTQDERNSDPHVTSNKFSKDLVKQVITLLENNVEIKKMVKQHRMDLGYV